MWRVKYREFERGWGNKLDGFLDFETFVEALTHQESFNSKNTQKMAPDWYTIAEDPIFLPKAASDVDFGMELV